MCLQGDGGQYLRPKGHRTSLAPLPRRTPSPTHRAQVASTVASPGPLGPGRLARCQGSLCALPQCRPSKGRKRGFCWCVDKYGQPLPGFDARGKGDIHCYSMDSK